jgi:hypothetical protein
MKFLTIEDVKGYIFSALLLESENDNSEALDIIEDSNIALVSSKLGNRYDTELIFAAAGTDRHKLIIKVLVILVLYDLIRRNAARKVPVDFKEDWEWALKWLNDVRDGKEAPTDLPVLQEDDVHNQSIVPWGNNSNKDLYL